MSSVNKQREKIALDRQGTQKQKPESPTVSPPGVRVNTRYINSTKGTSLKKDAPSGIYTPSISGTLGDTGVYRHTTEPIVIRDRT